MHSTVERKCKEMHKIYCLMNKCGAIVTKHRASCLLQWKPNMWDRCWWEWFRKWFISDAGNLEDGGLLSKSPSCHLWSSQHFLQEVGWNLGGKNFSEEDANGKVLERERSRSEGRGWGPAGSVLDGFYMDAQGQHPWLGHLVFCQLNSWTRTWRSGFSLVPHRSCTCWIVKFT